MSSISTKQRFPILILLICCCSIYTAATNDTASPCRPDQASSLLQFKASFVGTTLPSWRAGSDCCHWQGVGCDMASGRVISLDISELNLKSNRLDPALFNLTSLRILSLASNYFWEAPLPASGFERLTDMIHLNFSNSGFSGQIPIGISRLKKLVTLDFSSNGDVLYFDEPSFQTVIANLSNLRELRLDGDQFEGQFPAKIFQLKIFEEIGYWHNRNSKELPSLKCELPSLKELIFLGIENSGLEVEKLALPCVGHLKQLTDLTLYQYDLSQSTLSWIGNLTSLERLEMSGRNLPMPVPHQIANLANLTSLMLRDGDYGQQQQVPSWISNFTKLTQLDISYAPFSGSIPSTIGNLSQLEYFTSLYCLLNGKIPHSLFALPRLEQFVASGNQFSGSLEDIPSPLTSSLSVIDLSENQLSGLIPKSFFQLTNLRSLDLYSNKLTGTVELSPVWRLKWLNFLRLSNNLISLVDDEDETFPSILNINTLILASCHLTKLPGALKHLGAISDLDLSSNQITGAIPSWIWKNHLNKLDLSHNKFTSLELSPSLVNMTTLTYLNLSFNRIQGSIPIPVTTVAEIVLDYSNNNFSSIIPNFGIYLENASYINFSNNKLSGHVPTSICKASKVVIMDLSGNNYSGSVPTCLTESVNLSVLKLRNNQFQGVLPENSREGCNLQSIDANGNQIEGKLPRSLSYCQELELLDVGNNQIVGSFPFWLGTLPNLRVLVLSGHFTRLQIIDLASNHFSENIHSEWFEHFESMMENISDKSEILRYYTNTSLKGSYQDTTFVTYKGGSLLFTKILRTFKMIDLSDNSFGGPIPKSLGKLVLLHGLNLSHNDFIGQIPSQLSSLAQLESLDLSWNRLSGEIPPELTSLTSLAWLNISYNNLTGRIPQGNQFVSFSNSSFEGNVNLCGKPLSKQCDTPGSTPPSASAPSDANSFWQDRLGALDEPQTFRPISPKKSDSKEEGIEIRILTYLEGPEQA
uniref:non-specific serine/threonine protein kinase n=1 Tax=Leersia perrieri TaxID=77586 RepID=A0A0D9UX33_9ORYZ